MDDRPNRLLLHGFDTLQCAYYLHAKEDGIFDFRELAVNKEALQHRKSKDPEMIVIGEELFHLYPHGTSSGYPFLLSSGDFKIECGEFNNPSFFVTFKSQALWRDSVYVLHEKFLAWAISVGLTPVRTESLTRVDYCFDYHLPEIDFDEDSFVSRSTKDSQYRENGKVQTFTLGRGDIILRVYDKVAEISEQSDKVWFYDLWKQDQDVWRIEWQVRKPVLRQFGIVTFEDLRKTCGDLLRHLSEEHTTLRIPENDPNRSRWQLHSLWIDLQEKIGELDQIGVCRIDGRDAVLEERKIRIGISVYGYLKRMGAIVCVQDQRGTIPFEESISHLRYYMGKIHDELNWANDVKKRIDAIECGEW
jgi:hypothetical protein